MQHLRDNLRDRKKRQEPPRMHVALTINAVARFLAYANDGATFRIPRDKWKIAMGFLFCQKRGDTYVIADAVGAAFGNDSSVEMPKQVYAHIERFEAERPGMFLGGWACSRPGLGLFASDTDMATQMYYQTVNPDALGLFFDLTRVSPNSLGLYLWRLTAPTQAIYTQITDYTLEGFTREILEESLGGVGIDSQVIAELEKFLKLKDN